jgi:hypothetical protein
MNKWILFACFGLLTAGKLSAQQKMNPRLMNYLPNLKPNTIVYRDTVYSGYQAFRGLFQRTGDKEMMQYLQRHQTQKILGQVLGLTGSFVLVFGVGELTRSGGNTTVGWILAGTGFASAITGGYLAMSAQRNLQMAVTLFNDKYRATALGIGTGYHQAGLVYQF